MLLRVGRVNKRQRSRFPTRRRYRTREEKRGPEARLDVRRSCITIGWSKQVFSVCSQGGRELRSLFGRIPRMSGAWTQDARTHRQVP